MKIVTWVKENTAAALAILFGVLMLVIKLLWDKNASLKAENVAINEKGKLEEMKHEDEKQTDTANNAVDDYERVRDEYLKSRK